MGFTTDPTEFNKINMECYELLKAKNIYNLDKMGKFIQYTTYQNWCACNQNLNGYLSINCINFFFFTQVISVWILPNILRK